MAWIYHDGRPYYIASSDARYEEPVAPMTFREPPYYDDGYYRSDFWDQYPVFSHGGYLIPREQLLVRAEDPPLTFREPPYGYYRSDFRDQYPVFSHGGYLIPREQLLVRAEDPPLTFREPPYGYYRSDFRDQYPVFSHGGYLIPREQLLVRAEDPPLTFREPPYGYYRSDFRDQHPVFNHGGYLMPREEVLVRAEDSPLSSWRDNPGYPYGSCIVECPQHVTTVELYAPQLCCYECERRVVDCLDDMVGVESVTVDQWQKKVVVVGRNLCPNDVLRRLQRDPHMNCSLFWHDR